MKKTAKIAILGFGKEGKAVFKYLKKEGIKNITVLDRKLDKNYLKHLKEFDVIYRSPGVPYNLREIQAAIASGVKISGCTELFFKNKKGLVIGVTGTKGKGTTSTLIYKMLKASGKDVYLAGNIGKPAVELLPKLKKNSVTVLELSSFQLQDFNPPAGGPEIAVVLNIFPDHMDAHKNFKEYFDSKANLTRYQRKKDVVFYAADNTYAKRIARISKGRKVPINHKTFKAFSPQDLKTPGYHNFKNAATAAILAMSLGVSKKTVKKVAVKYEGLPYHLSLIRNFKGRKIYNDSSSTNPDTTAAAILAFPNNNILIMGGKDKGLNYKPVALALRKSSIKLVVLMGENSKKIAKAIKGNKYVFARDLKSAVNIALKRSIKGSSIIFSPGSASFDMFRDYYDRGDKFDKIVLQLK